MSNCDVLNALSIDVEGFVESNRESFSIPSQYFNSQKEAFEIQKNTDSILENRAMLCKGLDSPGILVYKHEIARLSGQLTFFRNIRPINSP